MRIHKSYLPSVLAVLAVLAMSVTGCDTYQPMNGDTSYLYMTGTDNNAVTTMAVDQPNSTCAISVSAASKVKSDLTIGLAISDEALEAYNETHGTVYEPVPSEYVALSSNTVTIQKGSAISNSTDIIIKDVSNLDPGATFAVAVSITSVSGADSEVVDASRTIIVRLTRTFDFWSFYMGNSGQLSGLSVFDEPIGLTTYTYEVKFYPHNMNSSSGDNPARLMTFAQADGSLSALFRFNEKTNVEGENNRTCNRLQVKMPVTGELISNTVFENNKWYLLSVTFDGSTARLYVNGVEDTSSSETSSLINFAQLELGMSWGGYDSSQWFDTRICEIRVWDRALSATEIRSGLCAVNTASEGLKCYWKMDEGEGHVFHNSATTGSGYDLDWSKCMADRDGDGTNEVYDKSSAAEDAWLKDENNRCSQ